MAKAIVYSILAALLIAIHSTTAFSSNIHLRMTDAERLAVFGSVDREPEYDVRAMSLTGMRRKRKSNQNIECVIDIPNYTFELNFKPTPQYLATKYIPVWLAISDRHAHKKIRYEPLPTAMSGIGQFTMYQDVEIGASLVVYTDPTEEIVIEGLFRERIAIRSLPKRLTGELLKEADNIIGTLDTMGGVITSDEDTGFYVYTLIKFDPLPRRPSPALENFTDENNERQKRAKGNRSKQKVKRRPKVPQAVYPEMLIVLDYNNVRHRSKIQVLRKTLAFWNAIDLMYRSLDKPKIHLNIAGIIIATDDMATPYIAKNTAVPVIGNLNSVVAKMGKYFYEEQFRFPTKQYDIIIAMTGINLCADEIDSCKNNPYWFSPGYTTLRPVCSSEFNIRRTKTLSNTMVIHYDGELNSKHLSLVRHDYGYRNCDSENYFPPDENRYYKWPNCRRKLYSFLLTTKETKCLRNKPRSIKPVRKVLPGRWLSIDGQCQNEGFVESCKLSKKIGKCVAKGCRRKGSKKCIRSKLVPLPGSKCGINKYCNKKKKCIHK